MVCGNCGVDTPNYYGYKGGTLCPDCYDRLRGADATVRQEMEERLRQKSVELEGERTVSDYQQTAGLLWAGIGLLVMAGLILLS
ncbi:MAG: hypothetical protein ACYCW6_16230, partial [Candidatus Xenobia bacterium]